jgi:hypothetical protein
LINNNNNNNNVPAAPQGGAAFPQPLDGSGASSPEQIESIKKKWCVHSAQASVTPCV